LTDREAQARVILGFGETVMTIIARKQVESWMQRVDLTFNQMRMLLVIRDAGEAGATMGSLREQVGVASLSAITGLVDRLIEHDFVERHPDPSDRRLVRIRLSPTGIAQLEAMYQTDKAVWGTALDNLTDEQIAQVAEGLNLLRAALERWSNDQQPTANK